MICFLDSSAIVKQYADEEHSDIVRALEGPHLVSALARVEVASALWRKNCMGELSLESTALLTETFDGDWFDPEATRCWYQSVEPIQAVLDNAIRFVGLYGLRAYDAVQLASAVAARDEVPECTTFVCFDHALQRASAALGFSLLG